MSDEKELRELDCFIAGHLMGWVKIQYQDYKGFPPTTPEKYHDCVMRHNVPEYTTNPADALAVLEKCAKTGACEVGRIYENWFVWQGSKAEPFQEFYGEADTLPLAICRFARKLFEG